MSTSWRKRKTRMNILLNTGEDEDAQGLALDRILHGQSVIGKTSKTSQADELKFSDKDVDVVGTLEYGQYGVIDIVTCKLDGKVYVRKSIEKRFALRSRDQCNPQTERDILIRALRTRTPWAPHILCAFQTHTHLSLLMDYAEGGTLWDVVESSPHDGRLLESDLMWWVPQAVSAIHWCHSQNFVHRDIKPHNFVLTADARLQLIDFGSAAPLLAATADGSQLVPKRYCLVPCGTCDYISPEILQSHEEALVALEMTDNPELTPSCNDYEAGGYGRETDWWSFGAMLYEMAYGVAPFFANDIRQTYSKIMDFPHSLRFNRKHALSSGLQDLLRRLLTTSELRLGRQSAEDVMSHPYFNNIDWDTLHTKPHPHDLHRPQFTYSTPMGPQVDVAEVPSASGTPDTKGFSFSAFFGSSPVSESAKSLSMPSPPQNAGRSILREAAIASFIGFSWGPTMDAFPETARHSLSPVANHLMTPRPLVQSTPIPTRTFPGTQATPQRTSFAFAYATPVRTAMQTPLHLTSTARHTGPRRAVSDREAMKQLVDCVGMSARKRVLESGRKPRLLVTAPGTGSTLKALRFDKSIMVVGGDSVEYRVEASSTSASGSAGMGASLSGPLLGSMEQDVSMQGDGRGFELEAESSGVTELSYSPTPRPRPGSVVALASRSRASSSASTTSHLTRTASGSSVQSQSAKSFMAPAGFPPESLPGNRQSPPIKTSKGLPVRAEDVNGDVFSVTAEENMSHDVLDALERRHTKLMAEVRLISSRLDAVMMQIGERT